MAEARSWIEWRHPRLSIRQQCELLGLHRSNLYYEPVPEDSVDLELMRLLDEEYLRHPFFGSRKMVLFLKQQGHVVNRKKVQRLLRNMGLQAVGPRPRTTVPAPGHKIYPYLLRGLPITRPNQVWCSDITYVPLRGGYLYLVAVMDWFSRHVLAWRLSNSLEAEFCREALDEALDRGQPEIFNTDQGAQFTSRVFVDRLEQRAIAVSMDGRGRARDNIFIERLWRTVKYEDIYLKEYASGADCHKGLHSYFKFYCHERPHQALGYRTPYEVHCSRHPRRPRTTI